MRHLFDTPLGAQVAPIGSFKNDGDMDVVALAGLGAGILGGIFGMQNTEDTNDTNMRIATKTNQANKEINESQLAWARENYADQKAENRYLTDLAYERQLENRAHTEEYNSPAAIKQRLIDAGFNPGMVMSSLGGSLSSGSLSSVATGSAPKGDVPAQIPMQAARMEANNAFGLGINQAVSNYLALKQNEREDYRLASDITFADAKQRIDYLDYRLKRSSSETESAYIKKQMEALDKEMALNKDKFEQGVEWQNFQKEVQNFQMRLSQKELAIKQYLASNEVSLGAATIEKLASETNYLDKQAYEMIQNGVSKREIDHWISEQERMVNNIIHDDELQKKFNNGKGLGVYTRFSRWLLDPIKGVLSGNASVKPK